MSNKRTKRSPRVTLTKKNIESDIGAELLQLLEEITADGELSDEEITKLKKWLDNIPSDANMYTISFLKEMIIDALKDGFIDQEERNQIHYGILRTLPKEIPEAAQDEKLTVDRIKWDEEDRIYNLATERKIN
jgi:predicted ATPase